MKKQALKILKMKFLHWEFWPLHLVYLPVFFYYLWLSLKARSLTFFTATNPGLENGGLFYFSKYKLLNQLDRNLIPATLFFSADNTVDQVIQTLSIHDFSYPLVIKPDKLERGLGVKLLLKEDDLKQYLQMTSFDFVVQAYVDYSFEAGVFFVRHPDEKVGTIKSIVLKDFLTVTGNGEYTVAQLMQQCDRAAMQVDRLKANEILKYKPSRGENLLVEPIGNHNRGTTFLDGNHLISVKLEKIFDKIAKQVNSFYYGRIDLKAPSLQHFLEGKNLKILEINGFNSEPAHIYQPRFSLWQAWKILFHHWHLIYKISLANSPNCLSVNLTDLIEAFKIRKKSIAVIKQN